MVGLLGFPRMREEETQPGSILFKLDEANNPGRPNGPAPGLLDSIYVHGADFRESYRIVGRLLLLMMTILREGFLRIPYATLFTLWIFTKRME